MSEDKKENLVVMSGSVLAPPTPSWKNDPDVTGIRDRVIRVRDRMTDDYFEIGRLLYRINKDGLFKQWSGPDGKPYERFEDYVEAEVSFKFRKAKHLMSIWWWFAEQLADPDVMTKVRGIGYSKAAALVGVVDSDNVDVWVSKANEMTVNALEHEVKVAQLAAQTRTVSDDFLNGSNLRVTNNDDNASPFSTPVEVVGVDPLKDPNRLVDNKPKFDPDARMKTAVVPLSDEDKRDFRSMYTVLLSGEQRENIEQAINMASKLREDGETIGKGFLLDLVATGFLATSCGIVAFNPREREAGFLHEILSSVERTYGIDIVAMSRASDEVVYGQSVLDSARKEIEDAGK